MYLKSVSSEMDFDVICEIKYMLYPHGQLLSFHDQTLKAAPVSSRWRPRYFLDPYEIQIKLLAPSSDRLHWKDAGFVPSSAGKWSQVFHVSFFGRLPSSIIVFSRGTKITLCPLERNFQGDARNEFRAYYVRRGERETRGGSILC